MPYSPTTCRRRSDIEGYAPRHSEVSGDLSFMNIAKAQEEIEAAAAGNEAHPEAVEARHHRHDRRRQADETLIPSWRAACT